jgi:hypothetical protein
VRTGRIAIAFLFLLAGCAGAPAAPPPGKATLFGTVRLVPRSGVTPAKVETGPYADRRLAGVEPVDYDHVGFAVVYLEGAPSPGGAARVAFRGSLFGAGFEPAQAAVGAGGRIVLENADREAHVFSCPEASFLRRLAPGDTAEIAAPAAGARSIFALDAKGAEATVFVAPGPFALPAPSGRWELAGVPPGRARLCVWHPRFPPAAREVELAAGESARVDLEVSVETLGGRP